MEKLAYTIAEAAAAVGQSVDVIRRHIRAGNLAVKYPTSKPVIPADELKSWLDALPSEAK